MRAGTTRGDRVKITQVLQSTFRSLMCLVWPRCLLIFLFGCSMAGSSLVVYGGKPLPVESRVDRAYFGFHAHRLVERHPGPANGNQLSPWPDLPFGSWRLWDAYVAWPNLQPQRGRWNFNTLDKYVDMADAAGVEILLPLGLSPTWASARPQEPSSYRPGNAAEPVNPNDWQLYVRTVAERYKGRIRQYEIWNEINLKGFYSGSLETLLDMARIAYQEIKQVDPEAILVSPSITGDGRNPEWLDRYLSMGGGQYADVIGYHFYVPAKAPEAMLPLVERVRAIMRKHGVGGKPLWNTESGWWIENLNPAARLGAAHESWKRLDQQAAVSYVSRALILGWASGVSRFYWYAWDNADMGLYDLYAGENKPAARAYARTASWLIGRRILGCAGSRGVWVCDLTDSEGRPAHIVWREQDTVDFWSVPAAWKATVIESLDGENGTVSRSIRLGWQPVLIR